MKAEDVVLNVRVRHSCGANIARCNGKTASSTHSEEMAVRNVAEKAIAAVAFLCDDDFIPQRPRDMKNLGNGVWMVTYKAEGKA